MIRFVVLGQAQTAGSKRAFPFQRHDGKLGVRVSDDNPRSKDWKQQVAWAAREAHTGKLLEGPLAVAMYFHRVRPKGHFKRDGSLSKLGVETPFPSSKPDVLKLARAVEDAITGVLWRDDAQIVKERIEKLWSSEGAFLTVIVGSAGPVTTDQELVDVIVESLYHCASIKEPDLVSEGGIPADQRWWAAIEEAYKQGAQDFKDGLHP